MPHTVAVQVSTNNSLTPLGEAARNRYAYIELLGPLQEDSGEVVRRYFRLPLHIGRELIVFGSTELHTDTIPGGNPREGEVISVYDGSWVFDTRRSNVSIRHLKDTFDASDFNRQFTIEPTPDSEALVAAASEAEIYGLFLEVAREVEDADIPGEEFRITLGGRTYAITEQGSLYDASEPHRVVLGKHYVMGLDLQQRGVLKEYPQDGVLHLHDEASDIPCPERAHRVYVGSAIVLEELSELPPEA
jgi:hypothetical protein